MMIKFVDICWAHESLIRQQPLLFDSTDYQMMPGDYCLVIDESDTFVHFLSGNKVLCLSKDDDGEKYEYIS